MFPESLSKIPKKQKWKLKKKVKKPRKNKVKNFEVYLRNSPPFNTGTYKINKRSVSKRFFKNNYKNFEVTFEIPHHPTPEPKNKQ